MVLAGRPGFRILERTIFFLFFVLQNAKTGSGAHPTPYVMGSEVLSPVLNQRQRDADRLPSSSATDKNE